MGTTLEAECLTAMFSLSTKSFRVIVDMAVAVCKERIDRVIKITYLWSYSMIASGSNKIIDTDPTCRLSPVINKFFNMAKPAHTPPASPRSLVRKHFVKWPGSPGDELLAAAVPRGVLLEGRYASRTLHL